MWCIQSFKKMCDIWTELAESDLNTGQAAYAKKTAAMYGKMAADAWNEFTVAGYGHQILQEGEILADYIAKEHCKEVWICVNSINLTHVFFSCKHSQSLVFHSLPQ